MLLWNSKYYDRHCCIMEFTVMLIFFWILGTIKTKFGQIVVTVWKTFLTCFWLNAGDWKIIPGLFMILLKQKYSRIWPFLIVRVFPNGGESPHHQPNICSFPPHLEKFPSPNRFPFHLKSMPPPITKKQFSSYNPIKTAFSAVAIALALFLF